MQTQTTKPTPVTAISNDAAAFTHSDDAARFAVARSTLDRQRIPPDLVPTGSAAARLADLAFQALDHPLAGELTFACRRLLAEAVECRPLSLDAARTVQRIVADLFAEGEVRSDWGSV